MLSFHIRGKDACISALLRLVPFDSSGVFNSVFKLVEGRCVALITTIFL